MIEHRRRTGSDDPAPTGLRRLLTAARHSAEGLRISWQEAAFRQEVLAAVIMIPAAAWLGESWVEFALLAGSVAMVLIVELLNTAVETTVDRIGVDWNELSKRAKDIGSAAVLLAVTLCVAVWAMAFWHKFT